MVKKEGQSTITYVVLLAVILYVLVSGAIAVATSDDCGRLNASKHWQLFPPQWECQPNQ
jgi:hypothetical protein